MAFPMKLSALVACIGCRACFAVQVAGAGASQAQASSDRGMRADGKVSDLVTYLGSDLAWSTCTASHVGCVVDRAYLDTDPITIGGTVYPKGIFATPDMQAVFNLGGSYNTFETCYGIATYTPYAGCGTTEGEVDFTFYVDGAIVHYEAKKVSGAATCISQDVTGANTLELRAGKSGNGWCDHSAWGEARLLVTTGSPTASPTPPASGVAAIGDPHLTNIRGKKLELHHTGNFTLLQIPKALRKAPGGPPPLLRVDAEALQKGSDCSQSYIESLTVTGQWMEAVLPGGRGRYSANATLADPLHRGHKSRLLVGPGIRMVISYGITDTGVSYLNFRANNLGKLRSTPIGGLLGDGDGGEWGELRPIACKGQGGRAGHGALPAESLGTL